MLFEYDEQKNQTNIKKHGIPFPAAACVFFDYDRIEMTDDEHGDNEIRYNTIGDTSTGYSDSKATGRYNQSIGMINDILFVVYTERLHVDDDGAETEITRLISARMATNFERGCTMVNSDDLTREQIKELSFTKEELAVLETARAMPIVFDEDCPETTPEKAVMFHRVNPRRNVHAE